MQAIVLAAGLGTRLWPLTADRAKPAVPFLGKPLIAGILELIERHGFDRAVINTHHLPRSIEHALREAKLSRLTIELSHEAPEILGTAGAISKARAEHLLDPDQPLLVVNAKLYTDLDLAAVVETHRRTNAAVTMALRTNFEREHFREVLIEDQRVAGFGKGRVPEGDRPLLFTGIHVLDPDVVRSIPLGNSDTVADVYPPLIAARRVAAHVDDRGRWWEFSTLARYLDLHTRAHEEGLGPSVVCSPGARIAPTARVARSVLWEDARIEDGAEASEVVLGRGASIPAGERVERAVIVRREHAGEVERGEPYHGDQVLVRITS